MSIRDTSRCAWAGEDPHYVHYHDEEWGVPKTDSVALFEKLVLEGFQAGLSWITILRKRDRFRKVFDGFVPEKIARYEEPKIVQLMGDPGIVRNRAKIEATISNARAFLNFQAKQSFAGFLWSFVNGEPIQNCFNDVEDVPAKTDLSKAMSKALKREGFCFVGPTTMYAFMQSVGMVNDHITTCHRHAHCAKIATMFTAPR